MTNYTMARTPRASDGVYLSLVLVPAYTREDCKNNLPIDNDLGVVRSQRVWRVGIDVTIDRCCTRHDDQDDQDDQPEMGMKSGRCVGCSGRPYTLLGVLKPLK
jgi:hypothetical protein